MHREELECSHTGHRTCQRAEFHGIQTRTPADQNSRNRRETVLGEDSTEKSKE